MNWGSGGEYFHLATFDTLLGYTEPDCVKICNAGNFNCTCEPGGSRRFTLSASFVTYLVDLLTNPNRSLDEGVTISFSGGAVTMPVNPPEIECPADKGM